MGCGCKTDGNQVPNLDGSIDMPNDNVNYGISNVILRVLAFILMMFTLPIIMLAVIWFIFELLILNKQINMKKIVKVLSSKLKPFNEGYEDDEEDYDDYEDEDEFNEENYEMIDVEDITPVTRK
jgi:hypothetical protein